MADIQEIALGGGSVATGVLQLASGVALDTTLRSVTDQAGTASPLYLSTQLVAIGNTGLDGSLAIRSVIGTTALTFTVRSGGWSSGIIGSNDVNFQNNQTGYVFASGSTWIDPLARVHVRGDGVNPIARFENSAGSNAILFDTTGLRISSNQAASSRIALGTGAVQLSGGWGGANGYSVGIDNAVGGSFTGSVANAAQGLLNVSGTFASATASGNASFRPINISYTINNSAAQTGTTTGIFLNATETALNGMTHNFIDCQVNGVSNFLVNRIGQINTVGSINTSSNMAIGSAGQFVFSGRSRIYSDANSNIRLTNNAGTDFNRLQLGGTTNAFPSIARNGANIDFRLADDSNYCQYTGRIGNFTTIAKNAISAPQAGLCVFDTDLGKLCVFSTTWQTITSV